MLKRSRGWTSYYEAKKYANAYRRIHTHFCRLWESNARVSSLTHLIQCDPEEVRCEDCDATV